MVQAVSDILAPAIRDAPGQASLLFLVGSVAAMLLSDRAARHGALLLLMGWLLAVLHIVTGTIEVFGGCSGPPSGEVVVFTLFRSVLLPPLLVASAFSVAVLALSCWRRPEGRCACVWMLLALALAITDILLLLHWCSKAVFEAA